MNTDTIAAVATGAQVAAIGIIRLSGPDAISIADRLFFPARGGRMRPCRKKEFADNKIAEKFVSLQKKKMERFERVQTTHARSIRGGHL